MKSHVFKREERGVKDIGWLKNNFYFSFSNDYHPLRSAFGTLVAFTTILLNLEKGFGIHPHINMEINIYLIEGKNQS